MNTRLSAVSDASTATATVKRVTVTPAVDPVSRYGLDRRVPYTYGDSKSHLRPSV